MLQNIILFELFFVVFFYKPQEVLPNKNRTDKEKRKLKATEIRSMIILIYYVIVGVTGLTSLTLLYSNFEIIKTQAECDEAMHANRLIYLSAAMTVVAPTLTLLVVFNVNDFKKACCKKNSLA